MRHSSTNMLGSERRVRENAVEVGARSAWRDKQGWSVSRVFVDATIWKRSPMAVTRHALSWCLAIRISEDVPLLHGDLVQNPHREARQILRLYAILLQTNHEIHSGINPMISASQICSVGSRRFGFHALHLKRSNCFSVFQCFHQIFFNII